MVRDPLRNPEQTVGRAAVRAATGHSRSHWFRLLDASGAAGWGRTEVVAWLVERAITPWWAEVIADGYRAAANADVAAAPDEGLEHDR